jgi:hypothetical protein
MVAAALYHRVSKPCQDQRQIIEIEIENDLLSGLTPKWIIGNAETPIKQGCQISIYDQTFCTKVCQLTTGDVCVPGIQTPGTDYCADNLQCSQTGNVHTCQPPAAAIVDPSLSSDYLYSWLNNAFGSSSYDSYTY